MSNLSSYDVVVFDLDDTLYSEKQYVLSGYKYLSDLIEDLYSKSVYNIFLKALKLKEKDVFSYVIKEIDLPLCIKKDLIFAYRYHTPNIQLHEGVLPILKQLKKNGIPMYLITDGRAVTQRLKVEALGIKSFFDYMYISEEVGMPKPSPDSFKAIQNIHHNKSIVYIADNPNKDFLAPSKLGWDTIGLLHKKSRVHPLLSNYLKASKKWLNEFKDLSC